MTAEAHAPVMPAEVLIVDDDDLFRESLEQNLNDAGYSVGTFSSGRTFLDYLGSGAAARLVILDWKMPEMNGIEVLKRLREHTADLPVMFLTALSDQIYEEAALFGGAVDFVDKSRSFAILQRRIELILSRNDGSASASGNGGEATVSVGELSLDPVSSRAEWRGTRVELTLTEFKIVHLLATAAGKDIRYREIYNLVRGEGFAAGVGDEGYRSNVRAFIKRIRQKFREVDEDFAAIETYTGFGYRWIADPDDND